MKYFLFILMIPILLGSCSKKKAEEQAKIDDDIILKYIADNNLTATKTSSGLYYVIDTQGTGQSCSASSNVKVYYKGYFTDASVFDESAITGATFNLSQVIPGWTEGIPYFKEGGIGKILIPSALGYGPNGTTGIPDNSVLIFDVELIQVL